MSTSPTLSPLDAAFLWTERDAQRWHVGCVAVVDGRIAYDDLVATVGARLASERRWRQRPVRAFLDWRLPSWEDVPHFDARLHVKRVAVPPPGGEAELRDVTSALFAVPLDPALPLWDVTLLEGLAGNRTALLVKAHHCMIDGVSGAHVLDALTDGEDGHAPPSLPPGIEPPSPPGLLERVWATGRSALELGATAAELFLRPATTLPFTERLTPARRLVWAAFPLDEVLALRGAAGCTVNDVVLATIAGALRRELAARGANVDAARVRALVPVSARASSQRTTLGNLVSALFPVLPVHVADPAARLQAMRDEMLARKSRGQAQATSLMLSLIGGLPAPAGALLGRLLPDAPIFSTACTNVPGPRGRRSLCGRAILDIHPIAPLFQSMGCEFAILSQGDRLSITACVDPALVPEADRLSGALRASFAELQATFAVRMPATKPAAASPTSSPALVASLMSQPVLAIGPEDSLATAWLAMRRARIRHLPVQGTDGRLVGLITHRDVLGAASSRLVVPSEQERVRQLTGVRVGEIMETHVQTAQPDEPAAHAGQRLLRGKIGCLPVVDRDGRLVGIVTGADFLRWAAQHLGGTQAATEAA